MSRLERLVKERGIDIAVIAVPAEAAHKKSFLARINAEWHERALWVYMAVVLAHWAEQMRDNRIFRPGQIYVGAHGAQYVDPVAR